MRVVSLKVLESRLSEYVRVVSGGETVLVTDHGRVVAELVPPGPDRAEGVRSAVPADASCQGWRTPPALPQAGPVPRMPVAPWSALREELAEARGDR